MEKRYFTNEEYKLLLNALSKEYNIYVKEDGAELSNALEQVKAIEQKVKAIQEDDIIQYHYPGYWMNRTQHNDYLWAECSECGFKEESYKVVKIGKSSNDYIAVKWKYCPKCGAKMNV